MLLNEIEKMKHLKISILTVLLIVISCNIKAQDTASLCDENQLNPFAIQFHVSPPMTFMLTDLKSDTYKNEKRSGLGSNIGIDFMYYYFTKGKLRANVSIGIAYSNYRSSRALSYEHSLWTTDTDNHEVFITEKVDNLFERQSLSYLDIPIKFGFEYMYSEKWSAYMSVGATYGFNLKGKYTSEARITRDGFYPALNALLFDVDVEGSPYFYPTNKEMTTQDEVISINKNISFEAVLGVKYQINEKISALFGVKYMHGFSNVINESYQFAVKHDDNYNYSLSSLASRGDKITTSSIGVEFGVQLNIWKIL